MPNVMPKQNPNRSNQVVCTPPEFLAAVVKRFGAIVHDAAATARNRVAKTWFGPGSPLGEDALDPRTNWQIPGLIFLNPPFGILGAFAARCRRETHMVGRKPALPEILMLSPAAVSTEWYHDYVWGKAMVYALRPRITFVGEAQGFPKDLAVFHFGPNVAPGFTCWDWKTDVVTHIAHMGPRIVLTKAGLR